MSILYNEPLHKVNILAKRFNGGSQELSLYIVNFSIYSEQNAAANCVHYMESWL